MTKKKRITIISIAAMAISTLIIALLCVNFISVHKAEAATEESIVTLSVDKSAILPGETFELTAEVSTTRPGKWYGISINLEFFFDKSDLTKAMGYDICQYFSVVEDTSNFSIAMADDLFYMNNGIVINLVNSSINKTNTNTNVIYSIKVKISEDYVGPNDFAIGMRPVLYNTVQVMNNGKISVDAADSNKLKANTVEMAINKYDVLQIASDSIYQFLIEEESKISGETLYFRKTYNELGLKHGVNDLDVQTFVIGQICEQTYINEFLSNFTNISHVRLYTNEDILVYDCGVPGEGLSESDLEDCYSYAIGSGWYIKCAGETIYLSVLGDIDGSGYVDAADLSTIYGYLRGLTELPLAQRLAARILDNGRITFADASLVSGIIMSQVNIEDYFFIK